MVGKDAVSKKIVSLQSYGSSAILRETSIQQSLQSYMINNACNKGKVQI